MNTDKTIRPGRPIDPTSMQIPPGLETLLGRQSGIFPAYRADLLEDASAELAWKIAGWRGRDMPAGDFGVMLLEMFAYLCDVTSFYDAYIAGESYLRTTRRDQNTRQVISLIGYIPTPAIAATATLALTVSGRNPVTLPQYVAFRSGKFADEKPQVFTLMQSETVHPLRSKFTLHSQPAKTFGTAGTTVVTDSIYCDTRGFGLRVGDNVLVSGGSFRFARQVTGIDDDTDAGGSGVKVVTLNDSVSIPGNALIKNIHVQAQGASSGLWAYSDVESRYAFYQKQVRLESVNRGIKVGEYVMLVRDHDLRWFKVDTIRRLTGVTQRGETINVKDASNNIISKTTSPDITAEMTALTLDVGVNHSSRKGDAEDWENEIAEEVTLYYGFRSSATVVGLRRAGVSATDLLLVHEPVEPVSDHEPDQFILQDLNDTAALVGGTLDVDGELNINSSDAWAGDLTPPVTVYGNTINVVRGERVIGEIIGLGDGNIPNQAFELKKKPLTYINVPDSADGSGYENTLTIRVDGILWDEVPRFYGVPADATVYIVRLADDGVTTVTFGDGVHGARLPTGASVVADYFFGAGSKAPPANSISQQVTTVKDVVAVTNPLAAFGGSDAQKAEDIKQHAPRSTLLLGRAVSLLDYQAVVSMVSGVQVATAEWQWSKTQQRTVVHIWYIAEGNLNSVILDRLRAISAENIPFDIAQATPRHYSLTISILTDPDYVAQSVADRVLESLVGEDGILLPSQMGINQPLVRSQLMAHIAQIAGVTIPSSITVNHYEFLGTGIKGTVGTYFDFDVTVSAQPAPMSVSNG